jgi:hypothetical protein
VVSRTTHPFERACHQPPTLIKRAVFNLACSLRDGTKETVARLGADLEEDAMPSKQTKAPKKQEPKPKAEQERQLAKELEMSFPASDPPASTQPGSGITGPEVVKSK